MATPHERFREWVEHQTATGLTKLEIAIQLGCHPSTITHLCTGRRTARGELIKPGLDLALALEERTRRWGAGPIHAKDWADHQRATGTDG